MATRGLNERLTAPPFYFAILITVVTLRRRPIDVRFTPKSGHRAAHSIISADGRLALDRA